MNKPRQARKKAGMQTPLTRTEARQFLARWELVNTAEQMELQSTSFDQKLRQLAALMASADAIGWTEP
jgi:hypothetical protein